MGDRNLTTPIRTIFGDVRKGTVCRVCERNVEDGRSKYCSDRCRDLATAFTAMLNWGSVKERIKGRDNYTCQECGVNAKRHRRARAYVDKRVRELTEGLKEQAYHSYEHDIRYTRARNHLRERYNYDDIPAVGLEVDHIERVTDGGDLFDESNLQTLCKDCHAEKTAAENSKWDRTEMDFEARTLQDFVDKA